MPRADRDDPFYQPPGTMHYNIQLMGGGLLRRATSRYFEGLRPEQIEWVWMVEAKRRATPEEIRKLCAGKTGA
jgi:hypothetical protein